jgi:hypothetical protein
MTGSGTVWVVLALPGDIKEKKERKIKVILIPLLAMCIPVFQGKSAGCLVTKGDAVTAYFAHDTTCFILAFGRGGRVIYALALCVCRIPSFWRGFPLSGISVG